MESWQKVWREGLARYLTRGMLLALKEALEKDDEALLQGGTVRPRVGKTLQACPIALCGWKGRDIQKSEDVYWFFDDIIHATNTFFACEKNCTDLYSGLFTRWWDNGIRSEVRQALPFFGAESPYLWYSRGYLPSERAKRVRRQVAL